MIRWRGWAKCTTGVDTEAAELLVRSIRFLQHALPNAAVQPVQGLVRRIRAIKSQAEIAAMDQAGRILDQAMQVAMSAIQPGVRHCDAATEILATPIAETNRLLGSELVDVEFLPRSKGISKIQQTWTQGRFLVGETIMVRITAGCHGYHVPLGRTKYLGKHRPRIVDDARRRALDGMTATLGAAKPGMLFSEVEAAWRRASADLRNDISFGHWIGLDPLLAGRNRLRPHANQQVMIEPGMTFSMMPDVWSAGWGGEFSDPVYIMRPVRGWA